MGTLKLKPSTLKGTVLEPLTGSLYDFTASSLIKGILESLGTLSPKTLKP